MGIRLSEKPGGSVTASSYITDVTYQEFALFICACKINSLTIGVNSP